MEPQPGCMAILLAILFAIGGLATMSDDASSGPTPAPTAPAVELSPAP